MTAVDVKPDAINEDGAVTDDDPALIALRKAARKFARAQAARDKARDDLYASIRAAADRPGVTRQRLVDTSGVARQTVFDALKKPQDTDQASER